MKKKKYFLIPLLVASIFIFTMCGQKNSDNTASSGEENKLEESGEKKKLVFWCHENEPWKVAYEEMGKKFSQAHPDYEVVVESYPFDVYNDKIQTALTDKSGGPDIVAVWEGMAPNFIQSDGLDRVPDELVNELEQDYLAPTLGIYRKEGTFYGVPMEFNLEYGGMITNDNMLKKAGKEVPKTWDELRKLSKELAVSKVDLVEVGGLEMLDNDSFICNYLAMILQQGGQYLNEDGSVNFATPEGIKAMEEMLSMVDNKESGIDNLVNGEYSFNNVFQDKAYMASVGSWAIGEGEAYGKEFGKDFSYQPVPQYGDKMAFASETGWGLMVPANSSEKEMAWEFIKFFSQPENLVEHNIACSQLPPRKSLLDNEKYKKEMPHIAFLLDILDKGQWMGPYNTWTMREILNEAFISLSSQKVEERNIEEVLKDVSKRISEEARISYRVD
ncbi:MAG: ABC transporter substrate-binding protein [Finegoldia sp.]|nr:ABC transporter substrate-binding protein [Finegoldia sp.]